MDNIQRKLVGSEHRSRQKVSSRKPSDNQSEPDPIVK